MHFPRPFSFSGGELDTGLLSRIAIGDFFVLLAACCIIAVRTARLLHVHLWFAVALAMTVSTGLSDYSGWSTGVVVVLSVVGGAVWPLAFFDEECRVTFEKGFTLGLALLVIILYADQALLTLTGRRLYDSPIALRGPFFLPSQLGHHLGFCVMMLVTIVQNKTHSRFIALVAKLSLGLIGVPVLLSGTRSGLIGLLAAVVLLLVVSRPAVALRGILLTSLIASAFFVGLRLEVEQCVWLANRWQSVQEMEQSGDSFMTVQMAAGLEAFKANPVLGLGLGGFAESPYAPFLFGFHHEIHNSYLAVLVEGGVVGGALFLAALGSTAYRAVVVLWRRDRTSVACAAMFFGMLITAIHGVVFRERGFWVTIGYVGAGYAALQRQKTPVARTVCIGGPAFASATGSNVGVDYPCL